MLNALYYNTAGCNNTANGYQALYSNTTGTNNTANGLDALMHNTTGSYNTANGAAARTLATPPAADNTANGSSALISNTTGEQHRIGLFKRVQSAPRAVTISISATLGVAGESAPQSASARKELSKNAYIAGISGVTVAGGVGVIIDTNGHLGTVVSSERFKDAIKPMDKASEAILALKPVTFRYKHELDPDGIPQFGLVAEQVEKVNPDLVARDDQGKPYTVRYEAVNAMLLNEFLKEHRKVEEQEATISATKVFGDAAAEGTSSDGRAPAKAN